MPTSSRSPVLTRGNIAVALTLMAGGVLATTSAHTSRTSMLRPAAQDLPSLVKVREQAVASTERDVATLSDAVTAMQGDSTDPVVVAARQRADALRSTVQLTPLAGAGLVIELNDAPATSPRDEGVDPNLYVIHQQDVQAVVNALWAGGAKGIAVMDQRLVATSAVRCVGATLHLHGRVYSPPFRITAVGDPAKLAQSLGADPSVAGLEQAAGTLGLGYRVTRSASLKLPGYEGRIELNHAVAVVP